MSTWKAVRGFTVFVFPRDALLLVFRGRFIPMCDRFSGEPESSSPSLITQHREPAAGSCL